jgi:hypothetical protein
VDSIGAVLVLVVALAVLVVQAVRAWQARRRWKAADDAFWRTIEQWQAQSRERGERPRAGGDVVNIFDWLGPLNAGKARGWDALPAPRRRRRRSRRAARHDRGL